MQKDTVGDVFIMPTDRTISGTFKKVAVDEGCIAISKGLFQEILDAEATIGRDRLKDGYVYHWRNGVLGYYLLNPEKFLIHPHYAKTIKLKINCSSEA